MTPEQAAFMRKKGFDKPGSSDSLWDMVSGGSAQLDAGDAQARQEELDWKSYQQSRKDALADAASQNAYNSPEQQMNRYRQAGLNPNLIYGSAANTTAAMIRSSELKSSQVIPNSNPYGSPLMGVYNKVQQAVGLFNTFVGIKYGIEQIRNKQQDTINKEVQNRGLELANINKELRNTRDEHLIDILEQSKKAQIESILSTSENARLQPAVTSQKLQLGEQLFQQNRIYNKLKNRMTSEEIKKLELLQSNIAFKNAFELYEKKLREKYGLDPNESSDNFISDLLGGARTIMRSLLGK